MKHIFFDFDGTLVDSSAGIYNAFAKACIHAKIDPPRLEQFSQQIGPPIEVIAKQLIPDLSDKVLATILQVFRREYDHKDFASVTWHEGVLDLLEYLSKKDNAHLSVVTNKPTQPTNAIIREAGIQTSFQAVVGIDYRGTSDKGPVFTNKSEAIDFTILLHGCSANDVIYIGDTPADRECSHKSGVRFIAATYGFHRWTTQELGDSEFAARFSDAISRINL
jgi:phosphoglycolate phosphatase